MRLGGVDNGVGGADNGVLGCTIFTIRRTMGLTQWGWRS